MAYSETSMSMMSAFTLNPVSRLGVAAKRAFLFLTFGAGGGDPGLFRRRGGLLTLYGVLFSGVTKLFRDVMTGARGGDERQLLHAGEASQQTLALITTVSVGANECRLRAAGRSVSSYS
eukprot:CAMPEP_0204309480 /NCGR_PEP_ID=MMETSP0469-20131031/1124_1 /ASSEMBLY_ACC=CAM_ASM_000384 /TAXON_ID=2969 /ORGANISM="Oxyrrhis marina" /LENGTH=118 /DNA_ID=CAMNT_0051289109 /DNA_START=256 /DNA_END=612 /DNA_ORIENTATION=+